ncbi:MAG: NAD-dependent epimerase/dehydratase family protein [Longimicrobiales bacterium]
MSPTRKDFLKISAGGALAANAIGAEQLAGAPAGPEPVRPADRWGARIVQEAPRRLNILILGGTGFIGPFQVRSALDRGHNVTLFNRGSGRNMFPYLETLRGDRNGDYESLRGRQWDVVIDNATNNRLWIELAAEALKDSVEQFMFVSSRSAYADVSRVPMTADAPTWTFETAGIPRDQERLPYGLGKAEMERIAQRIMPGRTTILRPGLIIGPGDETDRFTYWPVRIDRGGEVLAPGDGTDPVQIIDVRDFTDFTVRLAEDATMGEFNCVGPRTPRPMAELLYGIRAVTTTETSFTWVPREFLAEFGVRPYAEMPVWRPPVDGNEGFARFDLTPEVEAGLTFRSLADTAAATLEYHYSRPVERQQNFRAGLSAEREVEVLAAWHARSG